MNLFKIYLFMLLLLQRDYDLENKSLAKNKVCQDISFLPFV